MNININFICMLLTENPAQYGQAFLTRLDVDRANAVKLTAMIANPRIIWLIPNPNVVLRGLGLAISLLRTTRSHCELTSIGNDDDRLRRPRLTMTSIYYNVPRYWVFHLWFHTPDPVPKCWSDGNDGTKKQKCFFFKQAINHTLLPLVKFTDPIHFQYTYST